MVKRTPLTSKGNPTGETWQYTWQDTETNEHHHCSDSLQHTHKKKKSWLTLSVYKMCHEWQLPRSHYARCHNSHISVSTNTHHRCHLQTFYNFCPNQHGNWSWLKWGHKYERGVKTTPVRGYFRDGVQLTVRSPFVCVVVQFVSISGCSGHWRSIGMRDYEEVLVLFPIRSLAPSGQAH